MAVSQTLYVDDRTLACPDAASLGRAVALWNNWSSRLGLQENVNKQLFFHITKEGRDSLECIAPAECITDTPVLLGVTLERELSRAQEAGWITFSHERVIERQREVRKRQGQREWER